MKLTWVAVAALLALGGKAHGYQGQDDSSFGWDGDGDVWGNYRGGSVPKVGATSSARAGGLTVDYLPPPGLCRVWLLNRGADEQPEPTTCERARLAAKRNGGRVIYGPRR
jgi:hypothetical protein